MKKQQLVYEWVYSDVQGKVRFDLGVDQTMVSILPALVMCIFSHLSFVLYDLLIAFQKTYTVESAPLLKVVLCGSLLHLPPWTSKTNVRPINQKISHAVGLCSRILA